ncbi:hypothetical protein FGIG_01887 [Fasciola gigantica]|uniref:Uncharacterized protein n=1 Tax=Fasciola gigantica TaxID=46835 RepID=A0A504YDE5_FASGI|nr:hypothetical protein FGIG_01887 [Fasciola gigantica]
MECDLNGDSGDAMNSNTSASDRSALYATVSRTRSREEIHINSGSHCHDKVDTILRTRSSSVGALHSCQIQPKVSRRERMRKALKLWRLRKRWEKEFDKQRSLPGPFAPVHVKDKRGSIHASLLLLFAVMQCICGFVFPFCDAFALNDTRTLFAVNHKYYLEIFLQSQYVGAILVLAYLQTLIWYYNGFKSKKQRADRKTHETDNLAENYVPLNRVNKHVIPEESLEPEPNGESDQSRSMVERLQFNFTSLEHRISEASSRWPTSGGTDNKNLSWHKEGMNLYLRLGAVEWELGQPLCHSELWIPKHVLRLIWVLWQTYFVFKYHRTMETHGTGPYEVGKVGRLGKLCEDHLGQVAKPYLYPLAIEYSLITGTLFYKMLQRVGKKSQNKMTEYPSCNSLLTPRLSDDGSPITNLPVIPSSVSLGETASLRAQQLQPSQSTDDVSRPNEDCRKHTSYRQLLGCKVYLDPECADDNDGHGDHTKGSNSARGNSMI